MSRSTVQFFDVGSSGKNGSDVVLRREKENFTLIQPVVANTTQIPMDLHDFYDLGWVDVIYQNVELDKDDVEIIAPNIIRFRFDDPSVSETNKIEVEVKYVYRVA